jgi:hypothetical protein
MSDQREYDQIKASFEARSGSAVRDDAFLSDAVVVFVTESLKRISELEKEGKQLTAGDKATLAIVARLIALPDEDKVWRVTFPYPFMRNENRLTPTEKKARAIALEVYQMVAAGGKVTHATAAIAARLGVSPQKVSAAYYEHKAHLEHIHFILNSEPEI